MSMDLVHANQRIMSLDVFRGITVALMILVNSPGNATPYSWLKHATWDGCTLADVVFPFFIIILGISSVLALTHTKAQDIKAPPLLKKIIERSSYIFLIGLLLNAIPHFDLSTLRVLGVLQRIAIVYFISSVLILTTRIQTQTIIMWVLLIGYGYLMSQTPATINENLVSHVDGLVFSPGNMYTSTFDPEGLLSTLPTLASVLIGNVTGYRLMSSQTNAQKFQWMCLVGFMLVFLGCIWGVTISINKSLWSSSYVLLTGGMALLIFAILYFIIEIKHWILWSKPFDLLGRHAMLAYILHVLFLKIQAIMSMHNAAGNIVNFRVYITDVLFSHCTPENAALYYAISYTMLWFIVMKCFDSWQKRKRLKTQQSPK